jgi:hypothetical protein
MVHPRTAFPSSATRDKKRVVAMAIEVRVLPKRHILFGVGV